MGVGIRALSVAIGDGAPIGPKAPTEFRIFRAGENRSTKGTFLFDHQAASSVMAYFASRALTPKMDYEHQSLHATANGQPAPNSAYAWTPQVRRGADGLPELWATDIKWTDRARAMIEAREYSYFSPVFATDDDDRVTEVWNVALTNLPALDDIPELIAASIGGDRRMKGATGAAQTRERTMHGNISDEMQAAIRALTPEQRRQAAAMGIEGERLGRFAISARNGMAYEPVPRPEWARPQHQPRLDAMTEAGRRALEQVPASQREIALGMGFDAAKLQRFAAYAQEQFRDGCAEDAQGRTPSLGGRLAVLVALSRGKAGGRRS